MVASTQENALILDPFTGSSTTGIASHVLGRRFIGIDKEEEFLTLSKQRFFDVQSEERKQYFKQQFYRLLQK